MLYIYFHNFYFQVGEFDWDEKTQGLILASFYYGYSATNFLGGRVAEFVGGHLIFGLGVVVPSVLTLLSPASLYISKDLFIVLRVLEGLAQVNVSFRFVQVNKMLCNNLIICVAYFYKIVQAGNVLY